MQNYNSLSELLKEVGFYSLTGSDGCLCAHIRLQRIDIDVHCWKSSHHFNNYWGDKFECDCRCAGIHITPLESEHEQELIKIGEIIREEISRPDMNIKIIIYTPHDEWNYADYVKPPKGERPREIVIAAPIPLEGFDFDEQVNKCTT